MDMSTANWLHEMRSIEDGNYVDQSLLDDQFNLIKSSIFPENYLNTYSPPCPPPPPRHHHLDFKVETSETLTEKPVKHFKITNTTPPPPKTSSYSYSSSSSSNLISFSNSNSSATNYDLVHTTKPKKDRMMMMMMMNTHVSPGNLNFSSYDQNQKNSGSANMISDQCGKGSKRVYAIARGSVQAQDHVVAERKRRERLNQRLIALSALLPGLKKMDKASVLGDAIEYIKHLQHRVKSLEKEATKAECTESVVSTKRPRIVSVSGDDDNSSSSNENFETGPSQSTIPEIEVRVSDKNVLVKIHCKNLNGLIAKILSEIEEAHLSVVNTNVMPFVNNTLSMTIIAQMDIQFGITVKDLVKKLRLGISNLM